MERLKCWESCPFVKNGVVRPCSEEVYGSPEGQCAKNIAADPAFEGKGYKIEATMNALMNHCVRVREGNKNAAVVIGGYIYRQNISEY